MSEEQEKPPTERVAEAAKVLDSELRKVPQLGNASQIGAFGISLLALVVAIVSARIGCANESNSKLSASAARARDAREVLAGARSGLGGDASAVWGWPTIRSWVSKHRQRLEQLGEASPRSPLDLLSGRYLAEAEALGELWEAEVGVAQPAAFSFCSTVQRHLLSIERAEAEGRVTPAELREELGEELKRYAADIAPRCALVLAASNGDRAAFLSGFFTPAPGKQISEDPYSALGANWRSKDLLLRFGVLMHPGLRPAASTLNLPQTAFTGCDGWIGDVRATASPRFEVGELSFVFRSNWSTAPGKRLLCVLIGASEIGLAETASGLEERPVPPRDSDWIELEFTATGDVEATFFASSHGIPIRARVLAKSVDWSAQHRLRLAWDASVLAPEESLILGLDEIESRGAVEARAKNSVTDPRAPAFVGAAEGTEVGLRCEARLRSAVDDRTAPCFRRPDGSQRRYAFCDMRARREYRYGRSWIFVLDRPQNLDLLTSGWPGCEVVAPVRAWTALQPRCRARPVGGSDCNRRLPDGRVVDFGDENRMHDDEAVGEGCTAVTCSVFAGDQPETRY